MGLAKSTWQQHQSIPTWLDRSPYTSELFPAAQPSVTPRPLIFHHLFASNPCGCPIEGYAFRAGARVVARLRAIPSLPGCLLQGWALQLRLTSDRPFPPKDSSPKTFTSSVNISAMTWSRLKKPCKCSHSKSMHSTKTVKGKPFTACNHPGCDCKKFRLTRS